MPITYNHIDCETHVVLEGRKSYEDSLKEFYTEMNTTLLHFSRKTSGEWRNKERIELIRYFRKLQEAFSKMVGSNNGTLSANLENRIRLIEMNDAPILESHREEIFNSHLRVNYFHVDDTSGEICKSWKPPTSTKIM